MAVPARAPARDAERRKLIVDAARHCFLQYGYGKTSLDDIARQAGISRPLIYRKYRNKEALFSAVFEDAYAERYPAADAVARGPGSKKARLLRVYELLIVEPWEIVARAPRAIEFFEACNNVLPEVMHRHEREKRKCTQAILGSKELAEVFMLAVDGLESDMPGARVMRRRLEVLIDRFVA